MNPITAAGLLLDGAHILFENMRTISVFSVNVLGIGALIFVGVSAHRPDRQWNKNALAFLSMGSCGFVLLSYTIVVISRIWHVALPILSNALLIVALLGLVTGLLLLIKKKTLPFDSATSLPHWLLLR